MQNSPESAGDGNSADSAPVFLPAEELQSEDLASIGQFARSSAKAQRPYKNKKSLGRPRTFLDWAFLMAGIFLAAALAREFYPRTKSRKIDAAKAQSLQKASADHIGVPVEYTNSIGMKLVLIPAGEFMMGDPTSERFHEEREPQHLVRITRPFYLGMTEVTQGQWEAVMDSMPWQDQRAVRDEEPDYPAIYVSWDDAAEYCRKLSELDGKSYRLPTDAEWEYACRATTNTRFNFGDNEQWLFDYAFCFGFNTLGENYAHRVGRRGANGWGLYDMHGNAWEWCSDWYSRTYYGSLPVDDPQGPPVCQSPDPRRICRGGGWYAEARECRSACRIGRFSPRGADDIGFRVAYCPMP